MNKAFLVGRLTRDAEVRVTQGQNPISVARTTIAVDRHVAKNSGENTADFISIIAFGKRAEFLEKYGKKGTKFVIDGRIQTGSYTNQKGDKVYTTDVVIDNIEFAESKGSGAKTEENQPALPSDDGFMHIPDGLEDEGLPFN